jgi:RNA recognition motif-containing protein
MGSRLYVGNLSYQTDKEGLQALFKQAGNVTYCDVVIDKETGRSRGFGFVEMDTEEAARKAVSLYNGTELDGRALKVNEARPREERTGGGGDRPARGGGGGGGYGRRDRGDRG